MGLESLTLVINTVSTIAGAGRLMLWRRRRWQQVRQVRWNGGDGSGRCGGGNRCGYRRCVGGGGDCAESVGLLARICAKGGRGFGTSGPILEIQKLAESWARGSAEKEGNGRRGRLVEVVGGFALLRLMP